MSKKSFIYFAKRSTKLFFLLLLLLNEGLKQFLTTVCHLLHQNWGILLEDSGSRILAVVVNFFQIIAVVAKIQAHIVYDETPLGQL